MKNRIVAFILSLIIAIGGLPLGQFAYAQNEVEISKVEVFRTYKDTSAGGTYSIAISGNGLSGVQVLYMPSGGDEYQLIGAPGPGSSNNFLQFKIDPSKQISKLRIAGKDFDIDETGMPKIGKASPPTVDILGTNPQIILEGQNLDISDNTQIKIYANTQNISDIFTNASRVVLDKELLKKLDKGINNIIIKRTTITEESNIPIETIYNQNNLFRIYQGLDIEDDQITIYPNRGKIGTETTITLNNNKENFSVFFLKEETEPFMYENMGEEPYYPQTSDNRGIIRVKVPRGLDAGQTYKVIISNNLDGVKEPNTDLTPFITKQQTIGDFYVVDAEVGPTVESIVPKEGTSAGSYVTIHGYRLEELKITGLRGNIYHVKTDHLEIEGEDPTRLAIQYEYDESATFNDKEIQSITRDFLVTIGRDAQFQEEYKGKNIFKDGDDEIDQLYVRTRTISGEDLDNPVKDVVIEITTTIVAGGQDYIFTEIATLHRGYTFLPSHEDPRILGIVPDKIQVESEANPLTKDDTILSIQGANFNVFRYQEGGEFKTNYPKVVLGGSNEQTGQIIIEKDGDGNVKYTTGNEEDNNLETITIDKPIFEVLDKNGNIVTGIGGNQVGDSITIKIPKELEISPSILNKTLPLAVANPKRDSKDRGIYSYENDLISFITTADHPIIEMVDPYIVTVEGGEDVIVEGRNFQDGITLFIDGREVQGVIRDIDRITTRGTLKFKAPKAREGENILQVMNPDGGADTHPFIYVKSMKIDPRITSIAPNKGTKDTLVVIKGDNFLKPDQTTSETTGLGFNKLIGTRVFLGKDDVNTYNQGEELEDYTSPSIGEKLLRVEEDPWTEKKELILSPYYKSVNIEDEEENHYSIHVDYDGNPTITGREKTYTFLLQGEDIKGLDEEGHYYNVKSEAGRIELTDEDDARIAFDISFDYRLFSLGKNEFGKEYLRVADYHDSLILERDGNHYIIEVDDMDKVTITDGKEDIYQIIYDGTTIKAIKGSQSFDLAVGEHFIKIGGNDFYFKTPYFVDPITGAITGHRAKVKNKNEIWVSIPEKSIPGFYDLMVRNPDTKSFTVQKGFEYLIPQSKPVINYVSPSQGSIEGGYNITIHGEGFEDSSTVYIAGVQIPQGDTEINKEDYKTIIVKVPKYPGDVDTDFITDKKFVPLVVSNQDGGSGHRSDLFAYVIASSRPKIDRINPLQGSGAGGDIIEIWGYDFRYFEPYKGRIPQEGDTNYEDIDRDGKWTRMENQRDCKQMAAIDHPIYDEYCASPVLPKVYFGNQEGKIVEFTEGFMKVIAPAYPQLGAVDIYILNNDAGISNKVRFTYEGSNPNIDNIIPQMGRKQGGERVDIIGRNFKAANINLIDGDGEKTTRTTHLVRFGEIGNKHIPREGENSGRIDSGRATVNLAGGLRAEYQLDVGTPKIALTLQEAGKTYTRTYPYTTGIEYIDLKSLKDRDDNSYPGFELVRVQISDGRLLIDRGYAPEVSEAFKGHLEVLTPSYYSIGNVNVVIENPDGISNKAVFLYKNPDSKPQITNITRDGNDPIDGDDGRIKIVQVHYQGGSIISVEGKDFREDAIIQIGNILTINPGDIEYNLPHRMTFTMPPVNESALDRLHKLVVINEDGGTAASDGLTPPIYIQFTKGESDPSIESITPDRGPTKGGTKITIKGRDFRETMEGYGDRRLRVYFGEDQVPADNIEVVDYKTLDLITPPGIPGRVEVKVENPDGTLSRPTGYFTYISGPVIHRVEDSATGKSLSHISVKGGQELDIQGREFLPGARVVFAPDIREAKEEDTGQVINIDGVPHILESGLEGSNFSFIDDTRVRITTPQGSLGQEGMIIINLDGGASPIYDIIYGLPEIEPPEEVEAELVFDRYIRVHWGPVAGADYYEIYEVDRRGRDEFIDSTDLTSIIYRDIEPNSSYRFLVKAVGDFGSSPPSLISNRVRTGRKAGYQDEDGRLGEYTTIERGGQAININLGSKDYQWTRLDLRDKEYKGAEEVIISIPLDLTYEYSYLNQVSIVGEDFILNFSPDAFRNIAYDRYRRDKDAGIRFKISYHKGNTNLNGQTSLGKQLSLEGDFYRGKTSEKIDGLLGSMELILKYDQTKAALRNIKDQGLYYYDSNRMTWLELKDSMDYRNDKEIYANINRLGRYTVLGRR